MIKRSILILFLLMAAMVGLVSAEPGNAGSNNIARAARQQIMPAINLVAAGRSSDAVNLKTNSELFNQGDEFIRYNQQGRIDAIVGHDGSRVRYSYKYGADGKLQSVVLTKKDISVEFRSGRNTSDTSVPPDVTINVGSPADGGPATPPSNDTQDSTDSGANPPSNGDVNVPPPNTPDDGNVHFTSTDPTSNTHANGSDKNSPPDSRPKPSKTNSPPNEPPDSEKYQKLDDSKHDTSPAVGPGPVDPIIPIVPAPPIIIIVPPQAGPGQPPLEKIARTPVNLDFDKIKDSLDKASKEKNKAYEEYMKNTNPYYEKILSNLQTNASYLRAEGVKLNLNSKDKNPDGTIGIKQRKRIDGAVQEIRSMAEEGDGKARQTERFLVVEKIYADEFLNPNKTIYENKIKKAVEYVNAVVDNIIKSKLAMYLNANNNNNKIEAIVNLPEAKKK